VLIFVAAWIGGGALWALGVRFLLHVLHARYDHDERMAEIAAARARQDEDIERSRAERAGRSRPDLVVVDAPTEVMAPVLPPPSAIYEDAADADPLPVDLFVPAGDGWPSDRDNGEVDDPGRHRLPTTL